MKTQVLYLLLFLSIFLFGCSKKAPDRNDVLTWIKSNDTTSITKFIKEYKSIRDSEDVDSEYVAKCKEAYKFASMNLLKFDNSNFYKMFGVWFERNTFYSFETFDSIPSNVLSKNIHYLNDKLINVIVDEMLVSPQSYSIFFDEFTRRLKIKDHKSELFLALALWECYKYKDRGDYKYFEYFFDRYSVECYILKYPDLLDKTKYQTLLELCKQPSQYYLDVRHYEEAYDKYKSCRTKYNNAREELRTELLKCPYGIPQENLAYMNSLQLEYDKAKSDYENTMNELDKMEPRVKQYHRYIAEIENIIKANINVESCFNHFDKIF